MAQLAVLAVASGGAYLGGTILGYGMVGAQIGWALGSLVGNALLGGTDTEGPRLTDTQVQASTYGTNIHIVYGTMRVGGTIIWAPPLNEYREETTSGSFLGIGGSELVTYRYTAHVAIGVCEGPVDHIRRIWANGNLIYEHGAATDTGPLGPGSPMRIYLGTETQRSDPLIDTFVNWSLPYKGLCYVVFEDFELEQYGNRIPEFSFEVTKGSIACVDPQIVEMKNPDFPSQDLGVADTGTITFYEQMVAYDMTTKQAVIAHSTYSNDAWLSWWDFSEMPPKRKYIMKVEGGAWWSYAGWDPTAPGAAYLAGRWGSGGGAATFLAIYDINNPGTVLYAASGIPELDFPAEEYIIRPMYYANAFHSSWSTAVARQSGVQFTTPLTTINAPITNMTYSRGALVVAGYGDRYIWSSGHGDFESNTHQGGYVTQIGMAVDPRPQGGWWITGEASIWKINADLSEERIAFYTSSEIPSLDDPPYTRLASIVYFEAQHKLGVLTETNNSGTQTPLLIDPDTGDVEWVGCPLSVALIGQSAANIHPLGNTLWAAVVTGSGIVCIPFFGGFTREDIYLYEIVDDLSERVNVGAGKRDTSQLTDLVYGYTVARPTTSREAIQPLMTPYMFDAVESDAKMKFVKRGGAVVATLPGEDLAVIDDQRGDEVPPVLEGTRMLEQDLPQRMTANFISWERNYDQSSQYAERLETYALNHIVLDIPVPLTHDQALAMVEAALYDQWIARSQFKWSTTREFIYVDPTDPVYITDDQGVTHRIRVTTRKELANGAIEWEGAEEDDGVFERTVEGYGGEATDTDSVAVYGPTNLFILDIPLLRDVDDSDGMFYLAANQYTGDGAWPGGAVFRSTDSGASWGKVGTLFAPVAFGYTVEMLNDFRGGNIFDDVSVLRVKLIQGDVESATEAAVLAGANLALVGDELIQFMTATAEGDDVYELRGLLRGRRGTQWAMSEHTSGGDRFLLVPNQSVARVTFGASEIGTTREYLAVTRGTTFDSAAAQDFTLAGHADFPYSVVELRAGKTANASSGMKIEWTRRARVAAAWQDAVDVALDEDAEEYTVEFWDSNFQTLARSEIVSAATTYTYPYADWSADFAGSPAVPIGIRVYQNSAVVGRGYPAQILFDPS